MAAKKGKLWDPAKTGYLTGMRFISIPPNNLYTFEMSANSPVITQNSAHYLPRTD